MPPGPALATALGGVEVESVPEDTAIDLLQGWARQLAHDQARFLTAMVQVERVLTAAARRHPQEAFEPWAGDEIGAALCWTGAKTGRELHIAQWLVDQLPWVHAELTAGRIDYGRAWTFVDVLADAELTPTQLECVCAAVLPLAPTLTNGQVRARLMRLLIGVDPGYAARRYRNAIRERGVHGYLAKDGTATITGTGLGADEAVAACERIEHLADAVKHAGHPATLHQIRADLYIRLLDGRLDGLDHHQMITAMLTDAPADDVARAADPADAPAVATDAQAGPDPAADPAADAAADAADDADSPDDADGGEAQRAVTAENAAEDGAAEDGAADPAVGDPQPEPQPADTPPHPEPAEPAEPAGDHRSGGSERGAAPAAQARRGGEVRVGLGTLMHHDEHPGEVPGWGPVIAEVARAIAGRQHRAQWRFAVTDAEGYLVLAGLTRRRPHGATAAARECTGGVVEIHLPATVLLQLANNPEACGVWAGVVADIAVRYTRRHQLQRRLDAYPEDRFARAALHRHVQVRDRTCIAPGCRRPARRCDTDHTLDHELGGLTITGNSGPLCRRHHQMKHEGGWHLEQPRPGFFTWTSPLQRTYHTRGEPICPPPPAPAPRDPDPDDESNPGNQRRHPILHRPPPEPTPPPKPPPPAHDPNDDVPPF